MTATSVEIIQTFDCRECKRAGESKGEGNYTNVMQWRCVKVREAKEIDNGKCFEPKTKGSEK